VDTVQGGDRTACNSSSVVALYLIQSVASNCTTCQSASSAVLRPPDASACTFHFAQHLHGPSHVISSMHASPACNPALKH
jgi:hypothetical protein